MPGKVWGRNNGTDSSFGWAGNYARQSDMIIYTRPNKGSTDIVFGAPVMIAANPGYRGTNVGAVQNIDATFTTADQFSGFAAAEWKAPTGITLFDQDSTSDGSGGRYVTDEPVPVFQRGSISVICQEGTPEVNGIVYVRNVAGGPGEEIGNITTTATDAVALPYVRFNTQKDENNVVEVRIILPETV